MGIFERGKPALNWLMAFGALGGMAWTDLFHVPLDRWHFAGSDAKTIYGSAWNLARGYDAYSLTNLGSVFQAQHVVMPPSWYGYAPVYPPPTLALLAPFTSIGMVPATVGMILVTAILMAFALGELLNYSMREYDLSAGYRVTMVVVFSATPLLAFALSMGNLSVPACALSILAFVRRKHGSGWSCGVFLALAILLKPHLAVWVALGLLLLPERRSRMIVAKAAAIVGGFVGLIAGALWISGTLGIQLRGYSGILRYEMSAGASMNAASREVLQVATQITSLHSLFGFWFEEPVAAVLSVVLLVALFGLVLQQTRMVKTEGGAALSVTAWGAFGMLAMYHRAYDGMVFAMALPWLLRRLWGRRGSWDAWLLAMLYVAGAVGASTDVLRGWLHGFSSASLWAFLLQRQAALANLCLLVMLVIAMMRERGRMSANGLDKATR